MTRSGARSYRDLSRGVRWLIILRVAIVTVMLGITVLLQLRQGTAFFATPLRSLYLIVGFSYFLTIGYSVLLSVGVNLYWFAVVQIGIDLLLTSVVVLVTGGVASLFSIIYFLSIIGSSILFYRTGSIVTAVSSVVCYSVAVWLPFVPSVAAVVDYDRLYATISPATVHYRVFMTSFGLLVVALLSSSLSESLRRAGEELTRKTTHLAELERSSENILQNISSGLITADLTGAVTYTNRTAERIVGIPGAELLSSRFQDVFEMRGDRDPFAEPSMLSDAPYRVKGWVRGRTDEPLLGMTFSANRDEQDRLTGIICSFQDLTDIKRMEDQVRRSDRLAVIGELAAGMAHEIRNPLASLSGSVQLLREELVLEDTGAELMSIVDREISRLNSIITDFLHFASPRPLQLQRADLLDLLREAVTLLGQSRGPNVALRIDAGAGSDFSARVDPQLLKQVFWNLSLNALDAMPDGGSLAIELHREAEGGIVVTFTDTGEGIPDEEMERIFTPFYSTKENGTGLGLAIVFKIVEAHSGRIEIESVVGKGTVFRLYLPADAGDAVSPARVQGGAAS